RDRTQKALGGKSRQSFSLPPVEHVLPRYIGAGTSTASTTTRQARWISWAEERRGVQKWVDIKGSGTNHENRRRKGYAQNGQIRQQIP
ncbi:hypothetical protein COCCADRAFT_84715, partial [Bipolaris zeicola 26-R-13]